ncbi:hypothetical protein J0X14_08140 [Muricauda sp. CAU 1633]|uniref:hypothetical protein n=1 Tax=Allomuricauda sp. CAU 1633 TaxID=2816036 RepID=UPI001A8EB809|nr:hypothetical protein [Muricauda sp. CAU 1633]MBO0322261.1 hypothetical protein [Muricauda sp. CAU 1633]
MLVLIHIVLVILAIYFCIGLCFGIYFVLAGAAKIDPLIKESKFNVRFLLAPGSVATWPVLMLRLLGKSTGAKGVNLIKTHRIIWLSIAIIVPGLLFLSIENLSFQNIDVPTSDRPQSEYEKVLKSKENRFLIASIVHVQDNKMQLDVTVKKSLEYPTLTLYAIGENGDRNKLIGQIGSKGTYRFTIEDNINGILLYDALKKITVTKFEF